MADEFDGIVFGKPTPKQSVIKVSKKAEPGPSLATALPDNEASGIVWGKPGTVPKTVYEEDQLRKEAIKNGILPLSIAQPLRGATFGLSDKAASAITSFAQHGDMSEYKANLERQQKQAAAYAHESPYKALGGELAGGILTGGAEARLVAGAVKAIPKVGPAIAKFADRVVDKTGKVISGGGFLPWGTRVAGATANASALGAIDAAGRSKPGAEGEQSVHGAELGAMFGAGAHVGLGALGAIGSSLAPLGERALIASKIRSPEKVGNKLFFDHLQTLGDTPDAVLARMRHMNNENEIHPGNVIRPAAPSQPATPPSATFAGRSGGGPIPSGGGSPAGGAGAPGGASGGSGAAAPGGGGSTYGGGGVPGGGVPPGAAPGGGNPMLMNPLFREGEATLVPGTDIAPHVPLHSLEGPPAGVPATSAPFHYMEEPPMLGGPGGQVPARQAPMYHPDGTPMLEAPGGQVPARQAPMYHPDGTPMLEAPGGATSVGSPNTAGATTVADLRAQGFTREQAEAQAAELAGSYRVPGKPVIVGDAVNARTQALLKTAASTDSPGQEGVIRTLTNRAQQQKDRLNLDLSTSISPDTGLLATIDSIDSQYKQIASPLYDRVRTLQTAPDQQTADFFNQNPMTRNFLNEYSTNRAGGNNPMSTLFKQNEQGHYVQGADGFENVPSMSDLIDIRKEFASHRNSLWDNTTGKFKDGKDGSARIGGYDLKPDEIKTYVNQLDDILSKRSMDGTMNADGTPGSLYRKALDIHSDGESIKTAADLGGKVNNPSMTTEAFKAHFDGLTSDAERSAMRSGATSAMYHVSGSGGLLINKTAGRPNSTNLLDKLNVLGLNDEGNSLMNNSLNTERVMSNTNRSLFPRSASPDLLPGAEGADSIPGMAAAIATGHWGALANGARNFLAGKGKAAIPDVADHLDGITTMGPNEFAEFIKKYHPDNKTAWDKTMGKVGALSQYVKDGVPATVGAEAGGLANDESYYDKDGVLHIDIKGVRKGSE